MRGRTILATTITALAVVVFVTMLARATIYGPGAEQSIDTVQTPTHAPTRLRIPSIGVSAAVESVGIAASGNMAVPRGYSNVGWYRGGVRPGQVGSAVMDGHVDNGLGTPAVFARLADIKKGSEIFVDSASGTVRFVVEEVATYPLAEVPLERIFTRADRARLNLITCEGEWVPERKTYNERVVVYAVLAP